MSNIMIFKYSDTRIGYSARTITLGEEFKMVGAYIEHLVRKAERNKRKKTAIFIEPQLETGYPDLVIVEYYTSQNAIWNENRLKLTLIDLKILFQIQKSKVTTKNELCDLLGFSREDINKSITRLDCCKLVRYSYTNDRIRSVKQKSYFIINKIVSVEAKLDKWNEAIRQADNNIWFSTESYILMNKSNCNSVIYEQCRERGVGIILVNGEVKRILKSSVRDIPASYASIQFNEWLQKSLYIKET